MNKVNVFKKIHLWVSRIFLIFTLIPVFLLTIFTFGFGFLVFIKTPGLILLLLALFIKGTYRYIWGVEGDERKRIFVSLAVIAIALTFNVIREYVCPVLPGPLNWYLDYNEPLLQNLWLHNWRFWWICMILKASLLLSTVTMYVLVFVRTIRRRRRK